MREVTITVSGPVGCGKSAILGEIEILCKALGVPCRYADEAAAQAEKNGTHADWTSALEMYKPSVVLVEAIVHDNDPASAELALKNQFTDWWGKDGFFYDPDGDISWCDKRHELAMYAYFAGKASNG